MQTYTDSLAEGKAHTIVQLLNQLQRQGCDGEALFAARRAYLDALSLCACQYRSSGRLLIDHSIGVASILAGLAVGMDMVVAGIAHAVYVHGDFGGWRRRIDEAKRRRIRQAAGAAAESLVFHYSYSERNPMQLAAMRGRASQLGGIDRQLLLMRLADLLDIYGELDALYCHNADKRRDVARRAGPDIAAIAAELGHAQLAAALEHAFARVRDGHLPAAVSTPAWRDETIHPPSYRVPLPLAAYRRVRSRIYSLVGR